MITVLLIILAVLTTAAILQYISALRDERRHRAPGRLVRVDGREVHVHESGAGAPTVVLESGIAASSISWQPVQQAVAEFTSVLSYDRPGLGWSAPLRDELSPASLVLNLERSLDAAGAEPPYILVGHSFGALVVQLYAAKHPERVAGLVLVDPALVSEWAEPGPERQRMLARGVRFSRRGAWMARFGMVRAGLWLAARGSHSAAKFVARAGSSSGGQRTVERLVGEVRKMPQELWPAIRAHWCLPKAFASMASYLAVLPATCRSVSERCGITPAPLVVISGGHLTAEQRSEHQAMARRSACGRHAVAERSGHWVHLDQPELIVDAVRQIAADWRAHR